MLQFAKHIYGLVSLSPFCKAKHFIHTTRANEKHSTLGAVHVFTKHAECHEVML